MSDVKSSKDVSVSLRVQDDPELFVFGSPEATKVVQDALWGRGLTDGRIAVANLPSNQYCDCGTGDKAQFHAANCRIELVADQVGDFLYDVCGWRPTGDAQWQKIKAGIPALAKLLQLPVETSPECLFFKDHGRHHWIAKTGECCSFCGIDRPAENGEAPPISDDLYYVEEMVGGRWQRSALGHMWEKEDDARSQLEDLRRRFHNAVLRLHSPDTRVEQHGS
jgi:hypothetical protein